MQRVAYCGGTFDLFHPGHVRFFRWCWENFDYVIVAVNPDWFVKEYKGVEPVQCGPERLEMVDACRWVDKAIYNWSGADSKPVIEEEMKSHPITHIVNGSDWTEERLKQQMQLTDEFLKKNYLKIELCPLPRMFSTTELKARVKDSE